MGVALSWLASRRAPCEEWLERVCSARRSGGVRLRTAAPRGGGLRPVTAHDYHSPPYHVSETRVRATGVSQPGSGWTQLLDAEADEIGGTFERDRL
jgi:hypothetical protein